MVESTPLAWVRHAQNYELKCPPDFPIAVWICAGHDSVLGQTFGLSIYAGGHRIKSGVSYSFEEAEKEARQWLEALGASINALLPGAIAHE